MSHTLLTRVFGCLRVQRVQEALPISQRGAVKGHQIRVPVIQLIASLWEVDCYARALQWQHKTSSLVILTQGRYSYSCNHAMCIVQGNT
jgi:PhoPQ-activated pathogenicity-related protein